MTATGRRSKGKGQSGGRRMARGTPPVADRSLAARRGALKALDHVLNQKRMLAHLPAEAGLSPPEAARAARLADTVLRHVGPLDTVIRWSASSLLTTA